jgi:serine phosphatase RsbU (regulator of sigma subunit)
MMALRDGKLDITRKTLGESLAQASARANDGITTQVVASVGDDLGGDVRSLTEELAALRREQANLQQAIFEAAQVQRKLCAPRELNWGEFEIAGEIFPVRHLSGDFFKVWELGSVLGLALGDIAGKGLSAGIWLAHLIGLIQRCARSHSNPANAVAEVNRELCQEHGEPPMTALFFARIDPQRGELVYCNAGLPAPLLLRCNGTMESLEKGGPMLGALQGAVFNSGNVTLDPGDMLIAYSDGVTECRNPQDEEFDLQRLSTAIRAASSASANQALFSTLGAVLDFADACSPADDLTLLVVRRREGIQGGLPHLRTNNFSESRRRTTSASRPRKGDRRGHGSKQLS